MEIEYIKDFLNQKNLKITILNSSDIKYRENVNFICEKHGEFNRRLDHFLENDCIECQKEVKLEKQRIKFIQKSKEIHVDKYKYDKVYYVNSKTKVIINCKDHGDFLQIPNNHTSGSGCNYCNNKLSNTDFIKKSNKIHNNRYLYNKTEYNGNRKYVTIICKQHGDFKQIARIHLDGFGCKKCNESIGEREISKILEEKNIEFIREYKFTDCKNKYPLPFDFFLPEYNICIEYNGIQHYEPVLFFGGSKSFKYRKKLDLIKKNYCEENNIKLIIIKHNDKINEIDIYEVLSKSL